MTCQGHPVTERGRALLPLRPRTHCADLGQVPELLEPAFLLTSKKMGCYLWPFAGSTLSLAEKQQTAPPCALQRAASP